MKFFNEKYKIDVDKIVLSRNYNNVINLDLLFKKQNSLNLLFEVLEKNITVFKKEITEETHKDSLTNILDNINKDISVNDLSNNIIQFDQYKQFYNDNENYSNISNQLENILLIEKDIVETDSEIYKLIPKFIYYSDYGNLDSEIYLPDVINKVEKNKAKLRTLSTLFNFVELLPNEIYEMGRSCQNPSETDKKKGTEQTNERQILLSSASSRFTTEFNNWWGQGNYKFKFEADGDYFRIKVSDNLRLEEIELEHRSRGLQWFFSFFLVFLVESAKNHKNTILLLDEPGVTLHPNSQKDLYKFFENLSKKNQLIYTTHSPFMINSNQLDNVYAVYVNEKGKSMVTSDLRSTKNKKQNNSIYPAFAALGLNISDTLLQGCIPVIVEGISDQIYFSALKNSLINKNILKTSKEIVFIPSVGVKGIKSILSLLSCIESSDYPYVIVDGDEAGKNLKKSLEENLYAGNKNRIICVSEYKDNFEVEDLMPRENLIKIIDTYLPKIEDFDDSFSDMVDDKNPICNEIKKYYTTCNLEYDNGCKVEIAKRFKNKMLKNNYNIYDLMDKEQQSFVSSLFEKFVQ